MGPSNSQHKFPDKNLQAFYEEFIECRQNMSEDQNAILDVLQKNTQAIETQAKATADLVSAWNNAQGFLRVIAAISKAFKILTPIAIGLGAIYYWLKTGHSAPPPPPPH